MVEETKMKNKGQTSLLWASIVGVLSLGFCVGLYIIFNEVQSHLSAPAIAAGGNVANISIITSMLNFAPVLMLLGLIIYIWITAAAGRGDAYA